MRSIKNRPYCLKPFGDSRTEQSHLPDCDINIIMKRALRGQASPYVREDQGSYGDATSLDFFEAHTLIAEGNTMFEELPSHIRSRFDNEVGKFLDFIQDPSNKPEAISLGLIKTPPEPEPDLSTNKASAPAQPKEGDSGAAGPDGGPGATPPKS